MLGKTIFPCTILCSSLGYDTCNTEHVRPVIRLLLANRRHCLQAVIVSKPDDIFGQSTCPWKEVSRQQKTLANKCAIAHTRLLISVSLQIGFLHAQTSLRVTLSFMACFSLMLLLCWSPEPLKCLMWTRIPPAAVSTVTSFLFFSIYLQP